MTVKEYILEQIEEAKELIDSGYDWYQRKHALQDVLDFLEQDTETYIMPEMEAMNQAFMTFLENNTIKGK